MNRKENTESIIRALNEIMKDDKTLQPLQRDVLEQFKQDPNAHQTGIFDLATGFGKTCIMAALMTAYLQENPKGKVVIAVPTRTLIENEADGGHIERLKDFFKSFNARFSSNALDIGAFYSERKEPEKQVVITTYNSLNNLANQIAPENVGLLLLDEAHHTITDRRIAVVKAFTNAAQYGLTATPYYSFEKSLSMVLGNTIAQVDVKKAIQKGLLADVKNVLMVSDISIDLASELGQKQDYTEEDYKHAVEKALKKAANTNPGNSDNPKNWEQFREKMALDVAKFYKDYIDKDLGRIQGKQCIINCRTQEEARIQAKAINTLFGKQIAGYWTTDSKDKTVLDRFAQKKLNVICQVGKLTEGFDDPDVEVSINYPTASQVLEAQRCGRPLHKVQNTDKKALIVDLCFKHPDCKNEIQAIRRNNQKLYMDILGAPVVRCEQIAQQPSAVEETPDDTPLPPHTPDQLPQLNGFHILSNPAELIKLSKEADRLAPPKNFSPIRPGMLTSTKLYEKYGINSQIALAWLKEAIDKKLVFFLDSDATQQNPIPLVEWVQSGVHICPALNETIEAKKKFEHLHPLLLKALKNKQLPKIRSEMLTSKGLYREYGTDPKTTGPWLEEAFYKDAVFYLDSDTKHLHPISLVEYVRQGAQSCYALNGCLEARKEFEKLHPQLLRSKKNKGLPQIREGMLTSIGLRRLYNSSNQTTNKWLKEAYQNREVFYLDSDTDKKNPILLVQWVRTRGQPCLALHEAPEARRKFEELHPKLLKSRENKKIPEKRKGMLSSKDLYQQYGTDAQKTAFWLERAFNDEEVFYASSDENQQHPILLVEYVKSGMQPCYALHEAPEARKIFEEMHPELLESKRIRELPDIRPGMLTSVGIHKQYGIDRKGAFPLLSKAFETSEVFYLASDTQKQNPIPLVEEVKSGVHACIALHEAPEAKRKFEELHPELKKSEQTKDLPKIRQDMKTSKDIYKKYKAKDGSEPALWLQRAYEAGEVFYLASDPQKQNPIPLIEWVKSGPRPCKALHEAPEAILAFEAWYKKTYGKDLKKKGSSTLQPRLHAASGPAGLDFQEKHPRS